MEDILEVIEEEKDTQENNVEVEYENLDGNDWKNHPIVLKIKEIIEKGNVSRIIVRKEDAQIVNLPLTVSVIGAVIIPWITIAGIVAALGTQCQIEFVSDKGIVTDINGKVIGIYDQAKDITLKGVDKAQELFNKGKDIADEYGVAEKVEDIFHKVSDTVSDVKDKVTK